MGESVRKRKEVAALRLGIDLGLTLIDTAEMYSNGVAEEIVIEAVKGRCNECFICPRCCQRTPIRRSSKDDCCAIGCLQQLRFAIELLPRRSRSLGRLDSPT
jgi:aryl-alcohol dehydrogenase-like predicted oxidoreductase